MFLYLTPGALFGFFPFLFFLFAAGSLFGVPSRLLFRLRPGLRFGFFPRTRFDFPTRFLFRGTACLFFCLTSCAFFKSFFPYLFFLFVAGSLFGFPSRLLFRFRLGLRFGFLTRFLLGLMPDFFLSLTARARPGLCPLLSNSLTARSRERRGEIQIFERAILAGYRRFMDFRRTWGQSLGRCGDGVHFQNHRMDEALIDEALEALLQVAFRPLA